jgi:hypothetical protein
MTESQTYIMIASFSNVHPHITVQLKPMSMGEFEASAQTAPARAPARRSIAESDRYREQVGADTAAVVQAIPEDAPPPLTPLLPVLVVIVLDRRLDDL